MADHAGEVGLPAADKHAVDDDLGKRRFVCTFWVGFDEGQRAIELLDSFLQRANLPLRIFMK
ncbi:hypothetical protein [Mesorhizobium sp. 131-3-5]|uniref:hypothetical protein n=1 Tax=Mesorhizobium sp. 131-3-5 TaxID=2744520 RepID=UPI0019266279|nr:hypothetical protein [Mesorhizobium sp. 131-3-5]